MIYMQEVIFCEQRGMATEIGFLEVPALTRQGISLPLHRYSYGRRLLGLRSRLLNLSVLDKRYTLFDFKFLDVQICNSRKMFSIASKNGKLMFQRRCCNQCIT